MLRFGRDGVKMPAVIFLGPFRPDTSGSVNSRNGITWISLSLIYDSISLAVQLSPNR